MLVGCADHRLAHLIPPTGSAARIHVDGEHIAARVAVAQRAASADWNFKARVAARVVLQQLSVEIDHREAKHTLKHDGEVLPLPLGGDIEVLAIPAAVARQVASPAAAVHAGRQARRLIDVHVVRDVEECPVRVVEARRRLLRLVAR